MQVPFIDLSRLTREIRADVLADWAQALERSEFVGGAPVTALEARLAAALGVRHAVSCGSGTDALVLALRARGIGPGDRVALPNATFWATYEVVVRLGATPVLLDIDEHDLQLSFPALVSAHQRFGLKAVILVHAFGWASARLREMRAFCREQRLVLLEDGAQAYGVEHEGEPIFSGADVATLSFFPAKVIGGSQDGGAVLTDDDALAREVRSLANHGRRAHFSYESVGYNSRLGGPNAYYLMRVLERADEILRARREHAAFYRQALGGARRLRVIAPPRGIRENGYLSVALFDGDSRALVRELAARGVHCGRVWPETMDAQPPAAEALRLEPLEISRELTRRVINLPLFYGLTPEERGFAVGALGEVLSALPPGRDALLG